MPGPAPVPEPIISPDVEEVLLTHEQITARVGELGAQLAADYGDRNPVLVSVLKGSIIFLADLVRAMDIPLAIDLMEVSSYGAATESSGQVRILKDLSGSIEGRAPPRIRVRCQMHKPARRLASIEIDYRGFTIPDRFVIGYGLDYDERYRNLPYIGVLRPSVYTPAAE